MPDLNGLIHGAWDDDKVDACTEVQYTFDPDAEPPDPNDPDDPDDPAAGTVQIDVKPGSDPNSINPRSRGVIPVAILSSSIANGDSADFDATTVDPLSLRFGPDEAPAFRGWVGFEDVNGDGLLDAVAHFRTQETGVACGDSDVLLTGSTVDGHEFAGADSIITVGCR